MGTGCLVTTNHIVDSKDAIMFQTHLLYYHKRACHYVAVSQMVSNECHKIFWFLLYS